MLASLLVLATAALQEDRPIVVEAERPASEKRVCRTERSTGSRVVKQVCKTATEQRKDDQDAQNKLRLGNRSNRPPDAFKSPEGQ